MNQLAKLGDFAFNVIQADQHLKGFAAAPSSPTGLLHAYAAKEMLEGNPALQEAVARRRHVTVYSQSREIENLPGRPPHEADKTPSNDQLRLAEKFGVGSKDSGLGLGGNKLNSPETS